MNLFPILTLTFIHTLWIAALLGLSALATRLILHHAQPAIRYAAALAWLFLLALAPLATAAWLVRSPTVPTLASPTPILLPVTTRSPNTALASPHPVGSPIHPPTIPSNRAAASPDNTINRWVMQRRSVTFILPVLWFAGSAAMLAWSLLGLVGAEHLCRGASPTQSSLNQRVDDLAARLSIRRRIAVLLSSRVNSPVLVGILKPVILLPPALLSEMSPHQLELILLHELAHVRRNDNLVNLLQRLVESALFFHPAVWLISAWIRQEREHCCDDAVLQSTPNSADRHTYAATLLSIHQWRPLLPVAASPAAGANLPARIRRILTRKDSMRISRISLAFLAVPVALSCVLLARADPTPGKIITVAKQGGDYPTIQSAIDAAPDGSIIRIAPGTWNESLTLSKPLTLEGAGWEQTTISYSLPPDVQQAARDVVKQIQAEWHNGPWFDRTDAAFRKYPLPPVLNIKNADGVTLRNLKIASTPGAHWIYCPLAAMTLVNFDHSTGRIDHCAILGSPGSGITLSPHSDLTLTHSLLAGLWNTGVIVGSPKDPAPAKAVITDCDIRNCYYAGIVLWKNTDVTIERCRISATAWHGIYYNDASPIIRDNMIFSVARACLYAVGNTHATVTGNLIAGSEMGGMDCLFGNHDVITENTFANNTQSGIQMSGNSSPTVERNIFFNQPVAVTCGPDGVRGKILPHPKLASDWIWPDPKITMPLQPSVDSTTHIQEIRFVGNSLTLLPDSPARAAHVGAANLPSDDSSFPPNQPEERAIMPEKGGYNYQTWSLLGQARP
ncbi:MAG TPA: M56 family metallopeptidase [Tepidisphaeraceae bacterium]|jgi:parallel beta-helix repeat protein|nr:M56 family metallopeptidase [Tepidisphaeraceae bacterium]